MAENNYRDMITNDSTVAICKKTLHFVIELSQFVMKNIMHFVRLSVAFCNKLL